MGQEPFARWWFHTAMVQLAGRKISKSLGNLIMVEDLLKQYSPDAIRLFLAGHHYRQVWEYDPAELEEAERQAASLRAAVAWDAPRSPDRLDSRPRQQAFMRAMAQDLDTPAALAILSDLAADISQAARGGREVQTAQAALRGMSRIFGLRLDAEGPEAAVISGWNHHLERTLP
jgi:L-cysteine:1D-myo-inositol 2-amino-2-deoxy-alpha-D-glucopyranoside ligase